MSTSHPLGRMSRENPTWGAPRIQSELQLLGYTVAESTVARYMTRNPKPPSQTWRTFLSNHMKQTAAIGPSTVWPFKAELATVQAELDSLEEATARRVDIDTLIPEAVGPADDARSEGRARRRRGRFTDERRGRGPQRLGRG